MDGYELRPAFREVCPQVAFATDVPACFAWIEAEFGLQMTSCIADLHKTKAWPYM